MNNNRRWLAILAPFLLIGSADAHSPFLLPNLFDLDKRDHVTALSAASPRNSSRPTW